MLLRLISKALIVVWLVNGNVYLLFIAPKLTFLLVSVTRHPDKNQDPGAQSVFMDISESYEVLMDDDLRAAFDAGQDVKSAAKDKRAQS